MNKIVLFGFVLIYGLILFGFVNAISSQFKKDKIENLKPSKTDVTEIYKDIYLEPYGCFSSLEEKFFARKLIGTQYDSGTILRNNDDIKQLVEQVIKTGYDIYGYKMLHKYNNDYNNITVIELGILGKLSGYNYISIFKYDENTRGNVYLTYSPPMDKEVDYDVKSEEYKENLSKSDMPKSTAVSSSNDKDFACGYQCFDSDGKTPLKVNSKVLTCGSVGFPTVKTPTRFAVYTIAEKL